MQLIEIINHFNSGVNETEYLLSPARSSKLQLQQCYKLDSLIYQAASLKDQAAARENEGNANLFLGFMCALGGLRSELLMWIFLKKDMPNEAWDCLVSAQMGHLDATRSDKGFSHLAEKIQCLEDLEENLFPPQAFLSAGFVSNRLDCSICLQRYSKCDHLRGKAYLGQFCEVIHRDPQGDHVALVDIPADKRCRVTSFKTETGFRDKLTWEIEPYSDGESYEDNNKLETKSTIMVFNRYPYLEPTINILSPETLLAINTI
ncbi:hypothetical protein [Pseudomonas sp. NFACC42-2]|uniref:hypothetical protein n=1 Tax=Pseudomonas sp. NFACC42-2 TaxID=1566193 RepID=UPI0008E968FA|nr:hypothetical protein [Pseudomonas sp. NFACC42-2]SFS24134.1 hypothetical protein SAMN03159318_00365 [Pseudomonas sp. NFACC42-2]